MADEHTVSGAEDTGPEPTETSRNPRAHPAPGDTGPPEAPGPLTAAEPTRITKSDETPGTGELIRVAPAAPRVQKPDVNNSVVLALAAVILAFTAISGFAIWAAASFDGGRPGITGPADGQREDPVIRPEDRTRPPTTAETGAAVAPGEPAPTAPRGTEPPTAGRDNDRAPAIDWTAVGYPQDCAGSPVDVRDARPLTPGGTTYVVQVRCAAGSGTAPDALYTYTVAPGGPPVLARTLMDTTENRLVRSLEIHDGRVTATLLGWSGPDVPRCCPDVEETRVLTP